jgi:hypothetical protein
LAFVAGQFAGAFYLAAPTVVARLLWFVHFDVDRREDENNVIIKESKGTWGRAGWKPPQGPCTSQYISISRSGALSARVRVQVLGFSSLICVPTWGLQGLRVVGGHSGSTPLLPHSIPTDPVNRYFIYTPYTLQGQVPSRPDAWTQGPSRL